MPPKRNTQFDFYPRVIKNHTVVKIEREHPPSPENFSASEPNRAFPIDHITLSNGRKIFGCGIDNCVYTAQRNAVRIHQGRNHPEIIEKARQGLRWDEPFPVPAAEPEQEVELEPAASTEPEEETADELLPIAASAVTSVRQDEIHLAGKTFGALVDAVVAERDRLSGENADLRAQLADALEKLARYEDAFSRAGLVPAAQPVEGGTTTDIEPTRHLHAVA